MGCIWRRAKLFPKKRRIYFAILCRACVFPRSRTTCTLPSEKPHPSCLARIYTVFADCVYTSRFIFRLRTICMLPSENPRLSCLACVLHRFCRLRINVAFRRCGNPWLCTTCTRPRAVLALLELLASSSFNFRVSYRAKRKRSRAYLKYKSLPQFSICGTQQLSARSNYVY